ncbi:MAG: ribonuclease PH [Proteobacteria bacterium]|nr:ribonuclease PH [Pseudomonadota bacterium]MBU1737071.1 ribonuclease PH [Pseudomonadota bacterium]
MRSNNRGDHEIRPITIEYNFQHQADGSVLIRMGNTHVLCAVSVEESVPPWLADTGKGWITAEYGMLPGATNTRNRREVNGRSGRTMEIQRLIGRSLRMMVPLDSFGERTLRVDCDVLNADGGTRTASITGAALALREAFKGLVAKGLLAELPEITPVSAISVGMVGGRCLLDLDYSEDSTAEVDANFVMTGDGRLIEVQGSAEGKPFYPLDFSTMLDLALQGNEAIMEQLWTVS